MRRSHRGGSLEVIVLPFLLLRPFRCEDCPRRRHNLFFMMLEERIIPLNLGLEMGMR